MTYSVFNPIPKVPIVANVPHSSAHIPPDVRRQFIVSDERLAEEHRLLVDWFTDELYAPIREAGGCLVRHDVSRFALDPERFADDAHEVMAKTGMGVLYTHGCDRSQIRRPLMTAERETMLKRFYYPYHAELISLTDGVLSRLGRCIVIDCHSYPERPLPYEIDGDSPRAEIVLGTDLYHTPSVYTARIEEIVRSHGYTFGVDRPFSGTYVPLPLYKDPRVIAFMLEIRRDAYMNESSVSKHEGFSKIASLIKEIVNVVVDL